MELTDEQVDFMKTVFIPRMLRKGSFLQRAGDIPQYGAFVAKGCLRSYVIDEKGKEHVLHFAPENWWLADLASLAKGEPSRWFIDAIEDSDLLLIDRRGHMTLMERIPGYAASFQTGVQRQSAEKDNRIVASLSASAGDRYLGFLRKYPTIALRVPQHMLASYLGISPETLSRVRKAVAKKKSGGM